MMHGVKTELAQQRRRLLIAALHIQRRPFATFLIIFTQLVEFTGDAGHLPQRRIIAAHIIHQVDQSFQRRLIERSMQGNEAKLRRRQQSVQRYLLRMADKGAVGFKNLRRPARFPFEGVAGDMRGTDIHSLEKLNV